MDTDSKKDDKDKKEEKKQDEESDEKKKDGEKVVEKATDDKDVPSTIRNDFSVSYDWNKETNA